MAEATDIPISLAVLALKSVGLAIELIKRLRGCFSSVAQFVDFHLVLVDSKADFYSDFKHDSDAFKMTLSEIIAPSTGAFDEYTCHEVRHDGLALKFGATVNNMNKAVPYPSSLLRNIALEWVPTKHVISLDTDLVPSEGFGAAYLRAFDDLASQGRNMSHLVIVAPGRLYLW
jgi:hypothetical protein